MFSQSSLLWDYILGSLLYILIVIGGLILLIVPGIIWAIKYQFYGYAIIDKKMNAFDAINESGRITQGHKWTLLGLFFANLGIVILGFLCLIVGIFAAIPVVELATAFAYRTLSRLSLSPSAPEPTPAPIEVMPTVVTPAKTVKKTVNKKVATKKKK